MLTYQFIEKMSALYESSENFPLIFNTLDLLSEIHKSIFVSVGEISEGGQVANSHAGQIYNILNSTNSITSQTSTLKFYRELDSLRKIVENASIGMDNAEYFDSLIKKITYFTELYDAFLSAPNGRVAAPLIFAAPTFQMALNDFFTSVDFMRSAVVDSSNSAESQNTFSLLLPGSFDLSHFTERLQAILSIYAEISQLLDISLYDSPLKIGKIESGSLYMKLIGDARALKLIDDLLRGAVSFIHRNYTNEGKLKAIPASINTLDELAQFTEKLRGMGLPVTEMEDSLQKCGQQIAKNLNKLLENQESITLNRSLLALVGTHQSNLLLNNRPLRLESGAQRIEPHLDE